MTDGELFGAEEFEGAPVEEELEGEEELMVVKKTIRILFEKSMKNHLNLVKIMLKSLTT